MKSNTINNISTIPYKPIRQYYYGENEYDMLLTDIPLWYEDPSRWKDHDLSLFENGIVLLSHDDKQTSTPSETTYPVHQAFYTELLARYVDSPYACKQHATPYRHSHVLTHLWMTGQWKLEQAWMDRLDPEYAKTIWQYTFVNYALKIGNEPANTSVWRGELDKLYKNPLPPQAIRMPWIGDIASMVHRQSAHPQDVVAYLIAMYRGIHPSVPIAVHEACWRDEQEPVALAKVLYMALCNTPASPPAPQHRACAAPAPAWYDFIATFRDAQDCEIVLALLGIQPPKDHPRRDRVRPLVSTLECSEYSIEDAQSMSMWNPTITCSSTTQNKTQSPLENWLQLQNALERSISFDELFMHAKSIYYSPSIPASPIEYYTSWIR